MSMVNLGANINLPTGLVNAYNTSINKMLCMLYRTEKGLYKMELRATYQDMEILSKSIKNNSFHGYDFIVLNSEGLVYQTTPNNYTNTDEQGYISINEKFFAHAHDTGYVLGKTKDDLNVNYFNEVRSGKLVCSNSFGAYGFTKPIEKTKVKKRIA